MIIQKAIAKAATIKRIEIQRKAIDPPVSSTPPPTPMPDAFIETDKGAVPIKMSRNLFKQLEKSMAVEYKKQQEEDSQETYSRRETMESRYDSYSRRETMESYERTPKTDMFDKIQEEETQRKGLRLEMPRKVPYEVEPKIERERSPSPGLWKPYYGKKKEKEDNERHLEHVNYGQSK